jgi:hypothetical protein
MAEREPDPRDYRGGVHEGEEGVVPREMIDDPPPQDESDPQALKDEALGEVTDHDHTDEAIDKEAGDAADATRLGGTGTDVEDLEEGKPVSRVDQPNLAAQTDEKKA